MTNPTHHACPDCGYTWRHSHDGSHNCATLLKQRLDVAEKLLAPREHLLSMIPECPIHGTGCVPHALEWIARAQVALTEVAMKPLRTQGYCQTCEHFMHGNVPDHMARQGFGTCDGPFKGRMVLGADYCARHHPKVGGCPGNPKVRSDDTSHNAPWLTEAHALCADYLIPSGHISDRLKALRAHIERLEDEAGTFDDCATKSPGDDE